MTTPKLRLKRLQVMRFRHVEGPQDLAFHPSYTVLLGKNGTGKSTLLDLISAVVSSHFVALSNEPFAISYEVGLPSGRLEAEISNVQSPTPPGARSEGLIDRLPPTFNVTARFTLVASGTGDRIEFDVRADETEVTEGTQKIALQHPPILRTPLWLIFLRGLRSGEQERRGAALRSMVFELAEATPRFDESLGFFNRIGTAEIDAWELQANSGQYIIPFLTPGPVEVHNLITKALAEGQIADSLRFEHSNLPFLKTAVDLFGFKAASMSLTLLRSGTENDERTFAFGQSKFSFERRHESKIAHDFLSYGQKRLLAFLYYLAETKSVVIADELVNGLHHEWITTCLSRLRHRQVFLTSQNPLLMDYIPLKTAAEARKTFVMCETNEQDHMAWRNMTVGEAEDLFDSYKIGFQQLGELLRVKGLW